MLLNNAVPHNSAEQKRKIKISTPEPRLLFLFMLILVFCQGLTDG